MIFDLFFEIRYALQPTPNQPKMKFWTSKWVYMIILKLSSLGNQFRLELQKGLKSASEVCLQQHMRQIWCVLRIFEQHKSKIFENFHFEKVQFPAPKYCLDWFLHLWNEVICAQGSLGIVLDTYKVHFGWLEVAVKLKSEYLWNLRILTKICKNRKFLKCFILKKFDFLPQNILFRLLPTPLKWS